jgi:hypothetical protein
MDRNWTVARLEEPERHRIAVRDVSDGPEKLRALAAQTRVLSRHVSDRQRSKMLRALAQVYDQQARDLECCN